MVTLSKVKVKETEYKTFGKCVEISNGIVKLLVMIDAGPRIINYSFIDGKNVMYEDLECVMQNKRVTDIFGEPLVFFGGHRLWASPESFPRTYYPNNEPVFYEETESGVRFVQKPQKINQYQLEFTVSLSPDSTDVKVTHKITNHNLWDITLAPWAITMLSGGGTSIVPLSSADTKPLANRQLAFWPYSDLNDKRFSLLNKYAVLSQTADAQKAFKFGSNCPDGFAMYFNKGDIFIKKFDVVENGTYPDGGMNYESYSAKTYIEIESLGELVTLKPEEACEHTEYWALAKGNAPSEYTDEKIDEMVEKYAR